MAKNKISCSMAPEINGVPSMFYEEMVGKKLEVPRPVANYIYSRYKASNMTDLMNQAGYKVNSQGEHNAEDVLKFVDYNTMLSEAGNIGAIERRIGATDNNDQRVDFTNAEEALRKADDLNNTAKGVVALVVKHGDIYNIVVARRDSKTLDYPTDVRTRLKVWDVYKQAFNNVGIDIENLPQELKGTFNAYNKDLADYLNNIKGTSIGLLTKKDLQVLYHLDSGSQEVQRLVAAFGSIDDAAQARYDISRGNSSNYTVAQQTLLMRAITHAKKFNGLDIQALRQQVSQMTKQIVVNSPEESIKQKLHELNKKYKIDINVINRTSDEIRTLSDATAEAVVMLNRKIRMLQKEKGRNAEGKALEKTLDQLTKELVNKRYYFGILKFLNTADSEIKEIDNMLANMPQNKSDIKDIFKGAKILMDIESLKSQYYAIVSALADDKIVIDESIDQIDIDNIRQVAKKLKDVFDKKQKILDDYASETMQDLLTKTIGEKAPDGRYIANIVSMAQADSSMWDYLYSVGRASNPIIASMGAIIRNAEMARDDIVNDFDLRIRRATDKLYKAGFNSEFMYDDDGHIISDIDWDKYKSARKAALNNFYSQGMRGFELKQAIENWEEANTEDFEVDHKNHRSERVPIKLYRKSTPVSFYDLLAPAQQEYYDTMMQIKGEIGTLFPSYAQKQFLPPQERRTMLDAVAKARNAKDVCKAIKNKFQNLWKIREDDTNFRMNGIIDSDEYKIAEGAFDNTPLRQIPIFYVNPVEQDELLKNFSKGLIHLASVAANYKQISEIAEVVEFMGNFTTSPKRNARDKVQKKEVVQNGAIAIVKDLIKRGKNGNTEKIINGFIEQHVYGQKLKGNSWLTKLCMNIIGYTSFKGLSSNFLGAVANWLVGESQMFIEAIGSEFYKLNDFAWAHKKLLGGAGVGGELMELLTNNMNHKATLMREKFDPLNENFLDKSHKNYYKSIFRQLVSHDCSFIGYEAGEYLLHYVNMYAVLHAQKVKLNGKIISLYDAYEVTNKQDGNSELKLKQGVTDKDGNPITKEFERKIKGRITYCNNSTHGAMNSEDKGIIHQYIMGRAIMNFRQWMVEHYSRRFRKKHYDYSLEDVREGYYISFYNALMNDNTKEKWNNGQKVDAMLHFVGDFLKFMFRASASWANLNDMQKHNILRVRGEMLMWISLLGLSFALGEPDEHKKDWWTRFWIYETKRLLLDTNASMPTPAALKSGLTILQSPMAGVNTLNSFLYFLYGIGDINKELKSGRHKGENKYWTNVKRHTLPFFKHLEQIQHLDEDPGLFQIFENSPTNH